MFQGRAPQIAFGVSPRAMPQYRSLSDLKGRRIGVSAPGSSTNMVANLVLVSVGTLVALVALQTPESAAAALYYTVHSTLVTAALFLVADLIASQRGKAGDRLVSGRRVAQPVLLGCMFMLAVLTVAGLPPLSGFIGKLMLLQAVQQPVVQAWLWGVVLVSSLLVIVGVSRAGSTLFWRVSGNDSGPEKAAPLQVFAVFWLLAASPLLVIFAGPFTELSQQAAGQLYDTSSAINTILHSGVIEGGRP